MEDHDVQAFQDPISVHGVYVIDPSSLLCEGFISNDRGEFQRRTHLRLSAS
jgi:hypothetical protein